MLTEYDLLNTYVNTTIELNQPQKISVQSLRTSEIFKDEICILNTIRESCHEKLQEYENERSSCSTSCRHKVVEYRKPIIGCGITATTIGTGITLYSAIVHSFPCLILGGGMASAGAVMTMGPSLPLRTDSDEFEPEENKYRTLLEKIESCMKLLDLVADFYDQYEFLKGNKSLDQLITYFRTFRRVQSLLGKVHLPSIVSMRMETVYLINNASSILKGAGMERDAVINCWNESNDDPQLVINVEGENVLKELSLFCVDGDEVEQEESAVVKKVNDVKRFIENEFTYLQNRIDVGAGLQYCR